MSTNEVRSFLVGRAGKSFSNRRGFSLLEMILVAAIIIVLAGGLSTSLGSFNQRQELEISALKLLGDLRQAQQFSRGKKTRPGGTVGYGYYGIRFDNGLGESGDREGWKIIRFCNTDGTVNCESDLTSSDIPLTDPNNIDCLTTDPISCEYAKSPVSADNPDLIDDTFFGRSVTIDAANSDFQVGDTIVFTPLGSATTNGQDLLANVRGDADIAVILTRMGNQKKVKIEPLTGYVQIQ